MPEIKSLPTVRFKPLGDKLLVKPSEPEEKIGSILLPDVAQDKPQHGVVIAAGLGRYDKAITVPMYCKKGDKIVYGKYSGSPITIDGEDLLILKEEEVFGILE